MEIFWRDLLKYLVTFGLVIAVVFALTFAFVKKPSEFKEYEARATATWITSGTAERKRAEAVANLRAQADLFEIGNGEAVFKLDTLVRYPGAGPYQYPLGYLPFLDALTADASWRVRYHVGEKFLEIPSREAAILLAEEFLRRYPQDEVTSVSHNCYIAYSCTITIRFTNQDVAATD